MTTDKIDIDIFVEEQKNYIIICTRKGLDKLLCFSPRFDVTIVVENDLTCKTKNIFGEDFPCRNILYMIESCENLAENFPV